MNLALLTGSLLSPPVLFFFAGALAVAVKADLDIPAPLPRILALYLLLSIGFRGGSELAAGGLTPEVVRTLGAAIAFAALTPLLAYAILRQRFGVYDAAALAASYGSISAVTFIAGTNFLQRLDVAYGGHMVAAMALMESPAIVVGVALARRAGTDGEDVAWSEVLRDAFLNGSVFVLLSSLVIGALSGERGAAALHPFTTELFQGALCLFLLDMGLVAAKRLRDLQQRAWFSLAFATLLPLTHAVLAIAVARALGLSPGNALLLTILAASASYIAVPAAMRLCVPQANPSLYVSLPLAITFPMNLVMGIPLYYDVIRRIWRLD